MSENIRLQGEINEELPEVLSQLLDATTRQDVREAIRDLEAGFDATWRPVGDQPHNFSTIHLSSDPDSAFIERVTNGIDATLEAAARRQPSLKACRSPRKLVTRAFHASANHMTQLSQTERRKLARRLGLVVRVHDGDRDAVTVDVRDRGVGLGPEEFPDTILSIHGGNKIDKWYLMGLYGQGGSTAFRFDDYSIIISREQSTDDLQTPIAFTIVRFREPEEDEKAGVYEYITGGDGTVFSVPFRDSEFEPGTLVRHINYGFSGRNIFIDFYALLNEFLFDPVIPFELEFGRSGSQGGRRTIPGSRSRLATSDSVEWKDVVEVGLGEAGAMGDVRIRYWVFKRETETKTKRTFIDPNRPILVTYMGQIHDTLPRHTLSRDCGFGYLAKDLVVQVDCEDLSPRGRQKLLTSSREHMTKEGQALVKTAVTNALAQEEALQELNAEREREFLTEGTNKQREEMKRRLAEMLNRVKPGAVKMPGVTPQEGDTAGRPPSKSDGDSGRHKPPLPTEPFPSFIRIGNLGDPLEWREGSRGRVEIESDAPDGFLEECGDNATLELSRQAGRYVRIVSQHPDFKGGRLYLTVEPTEAATAGTRFTLDIALHALAPDGTEVVLADARSVVIRPPRTGGGGGKQAIEAPEIVEVGPNVDSEAGRKFWEEEEWNEDDVAEVVVGQQGTTIFVSVQNKWLQGALEGSDYTDAKKKTLKWKFVLHAAFHAFLQDQQLADVKEEMEDHEPLENVARQELERVARTIVTSLTSEGGFED